MRSLNRPRPLREIMRMGDPSSRLQRRRDVGFALCLGTSSFVAMTLQAPADIDSPSAARLLPSAALGQARGGRPLPLSVVAAIGGGAAGRLSNLLTAYADSSELRRRSAARMSARMAAQGPSRNGLPVDHARAGIHLRELCEQPADAADLMLNCNKVDLIGGSVGD